MLDRKKTWKIIQKNWRLVYILLWRTTLLLNLRVRKAEEEEEQNEDYCFSKMQLTFMLWRFYMMWRADRCGDWISFFNLHWHWCSLGSKTLGIVCVRDPTVFMGETRVDLVFWGWIFSSMPALPCHLDPTHKQPLWDLILHCSKQHLASHGAAPNPVPGKNGNGPDSMWNKNAHNSTALQWGIWEVRCEYKRQNMRWKMERKGEREREEETEAEKERQTRRGEKWSTGNKS